MKAVYTRPLVTGGRFLGEYALFTIYKTNKRNRRYKLTRRQQNILKFWEIDESYIDDEIADLTE